MTSPAEFFAIREGDLHRPYSPLSDPEPIISSSGDVPGEVSGLGCFTLLSFARIVSNRALGSYDEFLYSSGSYTKMEVLLVIERGRGKLDNPSPINMVIDRLIRLTLTKKGCNPLYILLVVRTDQKSVNLSSREHWERKNHPYLLVGCANPIPWVVGNKQGTKEFHKKLMEEILPNPRTWDLAWLDPVSI